MKDNQLPAWGAKREAFVVCGASLTLVEWRNKRSGKELTCGCNFRDGIEFFFGGSPSHLCWSFTKGCFTIPPKV